MQTVRSVEDYYIDDDFVRSGSDQALAANIDLVTDTSDLFEMSARSRMIEENLSAAAEEELAEMAPEL